jgi:hypothetical protein
MLVTPRAKIAFLNPSAPLYLLMLPNTSKKTLISRRSMTRLNGKGLDAVVFEQHYQTPHIETGIQGFFINEEFIPVENEHQGRDDVQQVHGAILEHVDGLLYKGVVGLVHHRTVEHQGNGSPELGELIFRGGI